MTLPERLAAFEAIRNLLRAVMTDEQARLYPVLEHLGDLIRDTETDVLEGGQ